MSLSISFKSLSDNRPSDKTASLKVFRLIWQQRSTVAGLIKSLAARSLSNIHVYIRKRFDSGENPKSVIPDMKCCRTQIISILSILYLPKNLICQAACIYDDITLHYNYKQFCVCSHLFFFQTITYSYHPFSLYFVFKHIKFTPNYFKNR